MKLNVFVSSTKDGIMSKDKKYFSKLTEEERNILYENTLNRFFKRKNLDYKDLILITEKNNVNASRTATKNNKKIKEMVVILKETTPNLPVAVETTDSPIIIASAKNKEGQNICAIGLGTIENINNNLLSLIIDSLMKETDAAPFEMTFYIGACPSKENYVLDNVDNLTNSLWNNTYTKKKRKYYLDLRFAIFNQLIKEIVDPNYIYFDSTDTTADENYFSDIGNKLGKHLECVVYTNEEV